MKRILTCEVGDPITSKGKRVIVAEIITPGAESYLVKTRIPGKSRIQEGKRSDISAYPIAGDSQVMFRSPRHIGQDWEHNGSR